MADDLVERVARELAKSTEEEGLWKFFRRDATAAISIVLEEAAKAAMGPVIEVNISTNEPSLCGNYNGGNWSVPQPVAGYKGSDYGTGRYDAAAAIRSMMQEVK